LTTIFRLASAKLPAAVADAEAGAAVGVVRVVSVAKVAAVVVAARDVARDVVRAVAVEVLLALAALLLSRSTRPLSPALANRLKRKSFENLSQHGRQSRAITCIVVYSRLVKNGFGRRMSQQNIICLVLQVFGLVNSFHLQ